MASEVFTQSYLFRFLGWDGTNTVTFWKCCLIFLSSQSYTLPDWTNYNIFEFYTGGNTLKEELMMEVSPQM